MTVSEYLAAFTFSQWLFLIAMIILGLMILHVMRHWRKTGKLLHLIKFLLVIILLDGIAFSEDTPSPPIPTEVHPVVLPQIQMRAASQIITTWADEALWRNDAAAWMGNDLNLTNITDRRYL